MPCLTPVRMKNPLYWERDRDSLSRHREKTKNSIRAVRELSYGIPEYIDVPCGKCFGCMRMRVNGWVFRHLLELKSAPSAHFVTLTYNNESVPLTERGRMCFDKSHIQKYFKRIRKWLSQHYPDTKIKYHLAAEYGGEFGRSHYHFLVYGWPNDNEALDVLAKKWEYGTIFVGDVSEKSIRYVVEYITQYYFDVDWETPEEVPLSMYSNGIGSGEYKAVAKYLTTTKKPLFPIDGKFFKVPNSYLNILHEKKLITNNTYYLIKQHAYEHYENLAKRLQSAAMAREISPADDFASKFAQLKSKERRKYQLRLKQ